MVRILLVVLVGMMVFFNTGSASADRTELRPAEMKLVTGKHIADLDCEYVAGEDLPPGCQSLGCEVRADPC